MPDPISVIAAIVSTTTGAVENSTLPPAVKIPTRDAITSGGDIATSLGVQLNNGVARLPDPARQTVQNGIERASEQITRLVPLSPSAAQTAYSQPSRDRDRVTPMLPSAPKADSMPTPHASYNGPAADYASVPPVDAVAIPHVSSDENIAVFVPWFRKAGSLCAGINAPTLAALYAAENGFRYGPTAPVSPAGAMGPGQFMPATWARYGKDVHGNGAPDIFDVGDSVMASGHLLCDTYQQIEQWKLRGAVRGDTLSLVLAAYNAGAGAVLRSGGMPTGSPDYEQQTKPYVSRILATRSRFDWISSDEYLLPAAEHPGVTDLGLRVVEVPRPVLCVGWRRQRWAQHGRIRLFRSHLLRDARRDGRAGHASAHLTASVANRS